MKNIILDERLLQKVSNHPVHILNSDGDFSPSAFIPFCVFGNNEIGEKIDDLEVPVCNIFVAKNWNDQVCYELDLNLLKDEVDISYQLKYGLLLIIDINEERQFKKEKNSEKVKKAINYYYGDEDDSVKIHLNTIGNNKYKDCKNNVFTVDPVQLTGEGEYNLNSIKEEEVTESFLGMDQSVRGCQNEEHYDECTTHWYIENMREKCGCLPLSIALSDQVIFFKFHIL